MAAQGKCLGKGAEMAKGTRGWYSRVTGISDHYIVGEFYSWVDAMKARLALLPCVEKVLGKEWTLVPG